MKIAFINQPWNYCPPIRGGSIAIWTHEVARRMAKSNEVVVYAKSGLQSRMEWDEGVHYRRFSSELDTQFQRIPRKLIQYRILKQLMFTYGWYFAWYAIKVGYDLRKQNCEIIHIQNFPNFAPILRFFNPHSKIVLHMHGEWLNQLDRTSIERRLRPVDLILGCSDYITDKIRVRFPQHAHRCGTIFDGVDVQQFTPTNSHASRPEPQVLFVGRISPEKGLHTLMQAMNLVSERNGDVNLTLVGADHKANLDFIIGVTDDPRIADLRQYYDGDYRSQLCEILQPLARERVHFAGYVPHDQLAERFQDASILVNPSLSESFGMSLIEAMAAGVPVVATQVGGMVDIVEDGKTGMLVEPDDADRLAEAIIRLTSDVHLRNRMGAAARQRAEAVFSWDQIANDLQSHYHGMDHDAS